MGLKALINHGYITVEYEIVDILFGRSNQQVFFETYTMQIKSETDTVLVIFIQNRGKNFAKNGNVLDFDGR